jgi:hypothetical protein
MFHAVTMLTRATDDTVKDEFEKLRALINETLHGLYVANNEYARSIRILINDTKDKSEKFMCYVIDAILLILSADSRTTWQKEKGLGGFLEQRLREVQTTPLLLRLLALFNTNQDMRILYSFGEANERRPVSTAVVSNLKRCIEEGKRDQILPLMIHVQYAAEHVDVGFLFGHLELVLEHFDDPEICILAFDALHKGMKYYFRSGTLVGCSVLVRKIMHVIPEEKKLMACQIIKCDRANAYYDAAINENLLAYCVLDLVESGDTRTVEMLSRYALEHGDEELEKYVKCSVLGKLCFYTSENNVESQKYLSHYTNKYSIDTIYDADMESNIYTMLDNYFTLIHSADITKQRTFDKYAHIMRIQVDRQAVQKDMTGMVLRMFRSIGMTIVSAMRAKVDMNLPYPSVYSAMSLLQSVMDRAENKERKEMKAKLSVKNIVSVFYTISDPKRIDRALNQVLALMSSGFARDVCSKDFDIRLLKEISVKFNDDDAIKSTVSKLINRVRCTVFEVSVRDYVDVTIVTVNKNNL